MRTCAHQIWPSDRHKQTGDPAAAVTQGNHRFAQVLEKTFQIIGEDVPGLYLFRISRRPRFPVPPIVHTHDPELWVESFRQG